MLVAKCAVKIGWFWVCMLHAKLSVNCSHVNRTADQRHYSFAVSHNLATVILREPRLWEFQTRLTLACEAFNLLCSVSVLHLKLCLLWKRRRC